MSGASPTTAGTLRPSAFPLSHPQCCELNCVPERYVDVLTPGTAEWPCLETGRSETGLVTMMSSRQGRPRSQCDWCSRKRPRDRHKEKRPRGEAGGEGGGAAMRRGLSGAPGAATGTGRLSPRASEAARLCSRPDVSHSGCGTFLCSRREPRHLPRARPLVAKWLLRLQPHTCVQGRNQGKRRAEESTRSVHLPLEKPS